MYLQTADCITDLINYGIKPLITFTDALEAAIERGDEKQVGIYQLEIRGRLLRIQGRMEAMNEAKIRARKERTA